MKRKMWAMLLILGLILGLVPQAAIPVEAAEDTFFGVLISDTEGNMNAGGCYWMFYEGNERDGQRTSSSNNFVSEGEEVSLRADPKDGYRFVGWYQGDPDLAPGEKIYKGEPLETAYHYRFTAPLPSERPYICAVFEKDPSAHYGDQVQMWVGNTDGRAGDSTVMGGKVAVKYTPSWDVWPEEIVEKDGTDFVYGEILQFYKGDECTVYAQPDDGYKFVGWYHVNIEWGPGGGKSYEGDVISTETSFTYKPGETIVDGDYEPLRYVCAVFEAASEGTCTVSFDPGTGKGSMAPVTVAAGEEYELPECTFAHDNSKRVFHRWLVNDELKEAGESITVTQDTTVTATWHYTVTSTVDESKDVSTTQVVGEGFVKDTRLGDNAYDRAYDKVTASTISDAKNPTVDQMIKDAKEAALKAAQDFAGEYTVTVTSEAVSDPVEKESKNGIKFTSIRDAVDEAGDYYDYMLVSGEYYKKWVITVTLKAEYTSTEKPTPTPKPTPKPTKGFSDVQDPKHPYYKAIYWAADAGITKGYSDGTFGINRACTRSEAVMFLWRMGGKPEPKNASKSPFKDVTKAHPHYKAILWAAQKGITKGYSDGTFGVNKTCTRGHIMTFVWRFKGQPAPKTVAKSPFTDVPKNHPYYKAILWGSQKKVTNGMGDGTYGIDLNCTRGQIVTFLYRIR